ncbi:MAG: RHS repeat protein, partial [Methylobacteriaceae bacterium]|nr:RHS repeat protein [Methylobacteriaceae bacterium]
MIQEISPDRGTTMYIRDQRGLVTQRTDGRGIVTTYAYDLAGRPQSVSYSGNGSANDNVTFTWDEVSSGSYNIGRLTTITDHSGTSAPGTTKRTYDSKGRVSSETRTISGPPALTTTYIRDGSGTVVETIYPSGREVVFNRDAQGRVRELAMHANSSMPWVDVINPITWNPFGPVRTLVFANGLTATFGTDTDYRISSVMVAPSSGGALVNRSLAWAGDTLSSITDNVTSGNSETFGYSKTRRLTSASATSYRSYTWVYDVVGNRTSETLAGTGTTTYNYPTTSNQLTSLTLGSNMRSLGYDADGNITSDTKSGGPWTYSYDSEGRLAQATGSTTGGTYTYDGLWRLAKRVVTSPSSETHYLQDP